jgi:D-sedoheptulose 7-phosphate isomerase
MTPGTFFSSYFNELSQRLHDAMAEELQSLCAVLQGIDRSKIIVVGNGGSAAMASHVAVDLTKAAGLRAINFNEADLITCFGNDYGYEHWVEKAIDFYADSGDVGIFISSSGTSPNIINGARRAKARGLKVVTLSGFDADNTLRGVGDLNFWVNSHNYNVVEITHQSWLLMAVDRIAGQGAKS